MKKKKQEVVVVKETKFSRVYEDDNMKSTWHYDYKKHPLIGLVGVEVEYKNEVAEPTKRKRKTKIK